MRVLTQDELYEWLDRVAQELALIAPVELEGKLYYREVASSLDIAWGFERTDMSPKTWLLPATDPILMVEQGDEVRVTPAPPPEPKVVFGVRPCDARGMRALDALYLDKEPVDERYAQHREATTLVGLSCPRMWDSCFCTAVGGAPDSTDGLDILLTQVESGYAVQVLSEKGARLAVDMPGQERAITLPEPEITDRLPSLRPSAEWNSLFKEAMWEHLGDRCLGCRVCGFVCPTCRCFDVRDEVVKSWPGGKQVSRLRAWDTCAVTSYRRIAGGHNPRPTQASRLRNRFYCKFVYYPDDYGPLGCVGCGRCITACPVGVDILEVIESVDALAGEAVS